MEVRLPNGTVLRNIPEGTNKFQIMEKAIASGLATPEDFGQESYSASGSGIQNFFAGMGKSVVDTGRGIRQIGAEIGNKAGLVSDETVQDLRADQDEVNVRDAELMSSGAGIAGNITGTVATTLLPAGLAAKGAQGAGALRSAQALRAFVNPGTARAAAASGATLGALAPVGTGDSRLANAAIGGTVGAAIPAAGAVASRVAEPVRNAVSRGAQSAVQLLERAGVPLTVAQRTGSNILNRVQSSLNDNPITSGRNREFVDRQLTAFTRAVLKTIGVNADEATPGVINNAATRIGAVFDRVARKADMSFDTQFGNELTQIVDGANKGLTDDMIRLFNKQVDDIASAIDPETGAVNGARFNSIRSRLGSLSRKADIGEHARALDNALLDMLERQNPAEAAALQEARAQWRNYLSILPAINKDADKFIRPQRLLGVLTTKANQNLSRRGLGAQSSLDLVELAEAGASVIPDRMPNSGTTGRAIMQLAVPGAIGAGVGYSQEGDISGALAYGAGGVAAPYVIQRALQSQGGLGNYLSRGVQGPVRNALGATSRAPGLLTGNVPAIAAPLLLSE